MHRRVLNSFLLCREPRRIMRRDQIYFVEKDQKTSVSEFYSLDEFIPVTSKNIRKAYLLGHYDAVPTIDDEELP